MTYKPKTTKAQRAALFDFVSADWPNMRTPLKLVLEDLEQAEAYINEMLPAALHEVEPTCPHPSYRLREDGTRECDDCGSRLPGLDCILSCPDPECQHCEPGCKHALWAWRGGKGRTIIRYCLDCGADLPYNVDMVRDHNPFIHHCGDPECRQCNEYRNREIRDP